MLKNLQAALIMYTRLPLSSANLDSQHFSNSLAYLPWVGICVGLLVGLVYYLCNFFLPANISVFMALVAGIMITGALHEDGFADSCDGFFAGQDAQSIVRIMKDSTNGTFAVLGLIVLFTGKLLFLTQITPEKHILALISMHALARLVPLWIVKTTPHCHVASSKMSAGLLLSPQSFRLSALLLLLLLAFSIPLGLLLLLAIALILLAMGCSRFFMQRLHGYNGDSLGAAEQLGECLVLLLFVIYL